MTNLSVRLGKTDEQLESFVSGEVQVKLEHDMGDISPLGDLGDQFFDDDDYNSYSQPSVEKTKEEETDDLLNENDDDDTAFCITPCSQKRSRGRPKKASKNKAITPG